MAQLTREALRQLQKHYRSTPRQEFTPTLSEIRIDYLLVNGDSLVVDTGQGQDTSPETTNESTCADNTLSIPHCESLQGGEGRPIPPQDSILNLETFHNTLQVNPDMVANLNQLISDTNNQGAGLSRIFDPNNKSMLLLDRTVLLTPKKSRDHNKRRSSLQIIKESQLNCADAGKLLTNAHKSKIPRSQCFNVPRTLKISKSKVDLKFPKLEM